MAPRTHIVGAGVAGLAAALAASRRGSAVTLYEAAPQAGGRCRTIRPVDDFAHDNGTHVLFTGNRRALALLEEIGTREAWIEPEPEGIPVYDAQRKMLDRVGLSPWSWLNSGLRPRGMRPRDLARLLRLSLPGRDRPVGSIMARSALARTLVEPLTVAVLNTPPESASSRRLGTALRRLARPGAARLLVANRGLTADLVDPALALLARRGANLLHGQRLRGITQEGGRVTSLVFTDRTVLLAQSDQVVLALPPGEIARLMPGLPLPDAFEPILNVHYRHPGPTRPRFVGLIGATAQWVLVRPDHLSVTVSAAGQVADAAGDDLRARIWREIAPALEGIGVPVDPDRRPEARIVRERRATIRQAAGPLPQPPRRPLSNLALAGDWLGTLPASIESAVTAGERAVRPEPLRGIRRPRLPSPVADLRSAP